MTSRPGPPSVSRDPRSGAALLELVRAMQRDLAHELRGPVQSVVVSAEVARRQLEEGDRDGVKERLAVIEQDVRRLHRVADTVLSFFRPLAEDRSDFDAAAVLDTVDDLVQVLARAARTRYRRVAGGFVPLVRSRPNALALAIVAAARAACEACGPLGELVLEPKITPETVDLLVLSLPAEAAAGSGPDPRMARAAAAANLWLQADGGTVEHLPGSDSQAPGMIRIRLPRADIA